MRVCQANNSIFCSDTQQRDYNWMCARNCLRMLHTYRTHTRTRSSDMSAANVAAAAAHRFRAYMRERERATNGTRMWSIL